MLSLLLVLTACDPASLPSDAPPPAPMWLSVSDVTPGQPFTMRISGAPANASVGVAASLRGTVTPPAACPPALQGLCLDLASPTLLATGRSDAAGAATLTARAPAGLPVGATVSLQAAAAAGAASRVGNVTAATVLDPACPQIIADFQAEATAIRSCNAPGECGQVLHGTSCGCTRDWVARNNANPARFYQLLQDAGACGFGLVSTCDCPQTYGFDCVQHTCTWDYTP